jgi:hypothetical protein
MVSRSADSQKIDDIRYYASAIYTITMTSNDTFTASEFIDTENLKAITLVKNSDGATLTTTNINNVVTLSTPAITNQECTLFIFGVRA